MAELKPCPFRKETKELYIGDDGIYACYYVYCASCHACGPSANTKPEAVGRWNAASGKEKTEMEKCCKNCVHISEEVGGKVYCAKSLDINHICKYWEAVNPLDHLKNQYFTNCKHSYYEITEEDRSLWYCGREIGNPEGYVR